MPDPAPFLAALARIFPRGRLLSGSGEVAPFESDGLTAFRARPLAVVLAETKEEVIAAVRACHDFGIPFVARGSGTSLSGGSVPVPGGLVIALNRLNRILKFDPVQRIAVLEPGVINATLSQKAAPHGLLYAPDPSSQQVCTVGGNVAFNSGGAHCLKYGMTSNHVTALTVVLPDGTVTTLGTDSLEAVGPDLVGLYVGSEGLWGIALEITVRLLPVPELYRTLLATYDSVEAAGAAVSLIVASGVLPGALEIMDRLAIEAAEAAVHAGYPAGAEALLIVELEGERGGVDADFAHLSEVIRGSGAREVRIARDPEERLLFWKGRKSAFSAVGRLSPDYIVQDGVVPRSKLGVALAEIRRMGIESNLRVANVFHAGDGNLHPLILYDGREPGALERAERLAGEILRLCLRLGGSITGEHGVGLEKRAYLPEMFNAADIAVMMRLRQAMDPDELSNRGKMFPDAEPAVLAHPAAGMHPLEKAGIISRE